jgi:pyruvate dehydrogenase E2 component (dihydrolipoamide acetyltransferase)
MPSLGADMDAGSIVEWRISPGDVVERGDVVAVVSTDKADIDVEVFESGTVGELLVPEGREVPVGTPLARIEATTGPAPGQAATPVPRAAPPAPSPPRRSPSPSPPPAPAARPDAAPLPPAAAERHGRVSSPLVRHLAELHHVDLERVEGTGLGGVITRADVERAGEPDHAITGAGHVRASPLARARAERSGVDLASLVGSGPGGAIVADDVPAPRPKPAGDQAAGSRAASRRRSVGELMARSAREVPQYHLSSDVDLRPALDWLTEANRDRPPAERILPVALLSRAVAVACGTNPLLNGHWVDGGFVPSEQVHLGMAVRLRGGGLVAPVVPGAQGLAVPELMARLRQLVARARSGRLLASDVRDATITVTNLGDRGSDVVFGVVSPPQVALVGFGRIADRPWVVDGEVVARPVVTASLTADHRVTDGQEGAAFLSAVERLLRRPDQL